MGDGSAGQETPHGRFVCCGTLRGRQECNRGSAVSTAEKEDFYGEGFSGKDKNHGICAGRVWTQLALAVSYVTHAWFCIVIRFFSGGYKVKQG